jgi:hypothetical protein
MPGHVTDTRRALVASVVYFAVVFAVAFVMGVARTLILAAAPDVPRLVAVLVEAPILVVASWFICRRVAHGLNVPGNPGPRMIMGGAGFAFVLTAEVALSVLAGGRSIAEHFALYADPSHATGLAAQVVFAIIPLVQSRTP